MPKEYWENKKVLVTGASGFIGSHFCAELNNLGAAVVAIGGLFGVNNPGEIIKLNLLDYSGIANVCRGRGIEVIIHCAALDGNKEFKSKNSVKIFDENTRMIMNVLNVAQKFLIRDVVIMSSSEIYPADVANPITEEDDYFTKFPRTDDGYVFSKIFAEIISGQYAKQFGLHIYLPRPTNVYGPGDKFDDLTNRVVPSMIKKALAGDKIEIWGDGSQTRQFIYVKDLVASILRMVEENKFCKLNIASDETVSILKLAELITKILQVKENIHLDPSKPAGIKARFLSNEKLKSIINFSFKTLKEGLGETIDWYKKTL